MLELIKIYQYSMPELVNLTPDINENYVPLRR